MVYIVMADIVMAYLFTASISMVDIVMAYIVMADIVMADIVMAPALRRPPSAERMFQTARHPWPRLGTTAVTIYFMWAMTIPAITVQTMI